MQMDLSITGGIGEGRKIAAMVEITTRAPELGYELNDNRIAPDLVGQA